LIKGDALKRGIIRKSADLILILDFLPVGRQGFGII